ncbi:MAG: type II toxin-antitoxin system RelE/ParE family toxin [Candidatus Diapherotrites archaeon]|nr:type II toxin-antitoxin system RelE/ParE family toxin [Candidatus Diapherotrites archaeon]
MFDIRFSNRASRFIRKCDGKLKGRLKELFEKLQQNPVPAKEFDLRKISGEEDTYRIRLSRYRVTYCVYWEQKTIRILKAEKRKESTYKF